jgi:MbtH protein
MSNDVEYAVVRNDEEQYSIWPTFREMPNGWHEVGKRGTKDECLDYIEEVWTDITPKSVREAIAKAREAQQAGEAA